MQRETGADNQNDPIEPVSSIGEQEDTGIELFWERCSDENKFTQELENIMKSFGVYVRKRTIELEKQVKAAINLKGV